MKTVAVIGSGPAGIMAALEASKKTDKVIMIEKNNTFAQKLSITGGGRCNVTNLDSFEDFFENIPQNKKFFYSAFSAFNNYDMIDFLQTNITKLKYEGSKAYPIDEDAKKLSEDFYKFLIDKGIKISLGEKLLDFEVRDNMVKSIKTDRQNLKVDYLIIATGGMSYCKENNSFDILKKKGIKITRLIASLTGFETYENLKDLNGLSVNNVSLSIDLEKRKIKNFGDIVFTLKGISGPSVLNMTSFLADDIDKKPLLFIDFLPNISFENLENILFSRDKKMLKTKLSEYLPSRLSSYLMQNYEDMDIFNMKKETKIELLNQVKNFKLKIKKYPDIKSAIVTKGGIDLKQVNPSTMNCKSIKNLYFAGECLDLDALTGGYNLQIAFSTGFLAGQLK